jgi:hypothetical protein
MSKIKLLFGFAMMLSILAVSAVPAFAEYEATGLH